MRWCAAQLRMYMRARAQTSACVRAWARLRARLYDSENGARARAQEHARLRTRARASMHASVRACCSWVAAAPLA
eukprot:3079004-Pleurochrysis_carterae.AAC.1